LDSDDQDEDVEAARDMLRAKGLYSSNSTIHDTRDMPYTYKGDSTTIEAVTGDFCPACGEVVMDMAVGIRHSAAML
jgi:YgiT-type zinc finger domain-containing protein